MDETAIYFHCKPKRTVPRKGDKTMIGRSSSRRLTLCVSVALDGTKLPLFVIFKGKSGGSIDRSLADIWPEGIFGCVQKKGWMDDRSMSIW